MTKDLMLSVRVSRQLNAKLERLAKLTERTKSWLVNEIMADNVDREIAYAESIREAQRSIDREGAIPHEQIVREVKARISGRRAKTRRQAAE